MSDERSALSLRGTKQSFGFVRGYLKTFARKLTDCFVPRNDTNTQTLTHKKQNLPHENIPAKREQFPPHSQP
jgi:hypothetical protein